MDSSKFRPIWPESYSGRQPVWQPSLVRADHRQPMAQPLQVVLLVMTTREAGRRRSDYVQSLARGLAVISVFDAEHPRMTLTEVAQRADLTRAAARRFLLTLV
ncbi:MAG: helix-turn-helix domain-containing protein, partial [Brooklawnia sp.]